MAAKSLVVICAQAALIQFQIVASQYISYPSSTVSGNSAVDNTIVLGNVGGINGGYNGVSGAVSGASGGFNTLSGGLNTLSGGLNTLPGGLNSYTGGLNTLSGLGNAIVGSNVANELNALNVFSSGPFVVTSYSPIEPTGISIVSENAIEGNLAVSGQLPYLGAVAFEGTLPSAGSGIATCGCGSGNVGIISEGLPNSVSSPSLGRVGLSRVSVV